MPFALVDEKKKAASDGNGFDELPLGMTPDELSKLIAAAISEKLKATVQKALDEQFYIEQPSGLKVCRFSGRIVDSETTPEHPRRQR